MDFLELAQSRRSIRSFTEKEISQEDMQKLLTSAQYAPSAGNCQPWRLFVVRDKAVKSDIAARALKQTFIETAPVVFVVCADIPRTTKRYADRGKNLYCIQDTAALVQNIMLCAKDLGLGTCWIGAFNEEGISELLGLTEEQRPVAIIPVGYPAKEPSSPTPRRPIDEFVTFIGEN